jgi:hypothetical protein
MCGIFLKHACLFLRTKWQLVLAIPLFMLLFFGVLSLFVFQLLAYWSASDLVFQPKDVYLSPPNNGAVLWAVLNFIQFVWGL